MGYKLGSTNVQMGGMVFEAYCDKVCKRKIVGAYDNSNVKSFEMIR